MAKVMEMTDKVAFTLAKVANNYRAMQSALLGVRGTLQNIERRSVPLGESADETTAAIARSGIRLIDDTIVSLEVL